MNSPSASHPHFDELTSESGELKETSVDDIISEVGSYTSGPDLDGLSEWGVDESSNEDDEVDEPLQTKVTGGVPDGGIKINYADEIRNKLEDLGGETDKFDDAVLETPSTLSFDGLSERGVDDSSKDEFSDCLNEQSFNNTPVIPDTDATSSDEKFGSQINPEEGKEQSSSLSREDTVSAVDVGGTLNGAELDEMDQNQKEANNNIEQKIHQLPFDIPTDRVKLKNAYSDSENGSVTTLEGSVATMEGSDTTTEGSEITTITSLCSRSDSTSQGTRSDSPFERPYSSLSLESENLLSSIYIGKSDKRLEKAEDQSSLDLQLEGLSAEFSSSSSPTVRGDSSNESGKSPALSSISLVDSLDLIMGGSMKIPGDPNAMLRQQYYEARQGSRSFVYLNPIKNAPLTKSDSLPSGTEESSSSGLSPLLDDLWEQDEVSPEVQDIMMGRVSEVYYTTQSYDDVDDSTNSSVGNDDDTENTVDIDDNSKSHGAGENKLISDDVDDYKIGSNANTDDTESYDAVRDRMYSLDEVTDNSQNDDSPDQNTLSSDGVEDVALSSDGVEDVALSSAGVEDVALSSDGVEDVTLSSDGVEDVTLSSNGVEDEVLSSDGVEDVVLSSDGVEDVALSSDGVEDVTLSSDGVEDVALSSDDVEDVALSSDGVEDVTLSSDGVEDEVLSSDGVEDVVLSSDGVKDVALSYDGVEDVAISSDGVEDVALSSGGVEAVALSSDGVDNVTLSSGGVEDVALSSDAFYDVMSEDCWFDAETRISDLLFRDRTVISRASDGSMSSADTSSYLSANGSTSCDLSSDEDGDISPRLSERSAELIGICNLLAEKVSEMVGESEADLQESDTLITGMKHCC